MIIHVKWEVCSMTMLPIVQSTQLCVAIFTYIEPAHVGLYLRKHRGL